MHSRDDIENMMAATGLDEWSAEQALDEALVAEIEKRMDNELAFCESVDDLVQWLKLNLTPVLAKDKFEREKEN